MSAPALIDTQRRMQALLLAPGVSEAGEAGDLLDAASARGLAVYRHAYRARLVAALRDNYGVLAQVMGDEAFEALAAAYVQANPSRHASIRWYGDGLADFLVGHEALVHPAFVDVARMDWTLRAVFDAADDAPLDLTALQQLAPEQWPALQLAPRASARLLALDWAIEPAWAALARHAEQRAAGAADIDPELPEPEPLTHLMLAWRPQLETRWRSLAADEAALVEAVFEGADWSQLGAIAVERWGEGEAPMQLVRCLQQWLTDGWLRALVGMRSRE